MKTLSVKVLALVFCTVLLAGCPWFQRDDPLFTSANLNINGRQVAEDGLGMPVESEVPGDDSGEVERELVEPDVIRRDGDLLYVLNQYRGLTIADLSGETVLSQTPTYGYPRDLYLVGTNAYVLVSYARDIAVENDLIRVNYGSKLYVLDVSNPAAVVTTGAFSFEGDLVDSRMVGNVIYAVTSDYSWYECCGGGVVVTDAANKSYGSTGAVSINIADPANIHQVDVVSFDGYGNLIQATNYAIFSVTNDYETNNSLITYIDIADPEGHIVVRGTAVAPGYMADRFKMDAWNGALRTVTNTWQPDRQTYVTTFDITNPDALARLGQVTLQSASGDSLFATRFDGPRAYVVTYFTVDPLFVLDLSDPAAPAVVGELKIPGWSTHIEPRGDRLVALGVDDVDGRRVMVSLFDVSDPAAPQRLDYASFGEGWSWSSAYEDVKSLTVLDDMILVPFSGWNQDSGAGYDRLQFISYTPSDLAVQGFVDLQGSVVRSFQYGDRYYAVTQEQLAVINAADLAAPQVETTLALAENVADVIPLGNGWTVEVIVRYDTGDTLLRAKNYESGAGAGSLVLPASGVSGSFAWNNAVVLVAPVYQYDPEYRAYYKALLVDFSDPAAPALTGEWTANIEPWWGGWWWGREIMPMDEGVAVAEAKAMAYYPWYYPSADSAFLTGDFLTLRGTRTATGWFWDDGTAREMLAVIDLAEDDVVRYVNLGRENINSMKAVDNLLYITTFDEITATDGQGASCAYYLQTLNPFDLETGPRVNVPGVLLHKVPGTPYLVLEDLQYNEAGGADTFLRSVTISGDDADLVDSAALEAGYWTYAAAGADIFFAGMKYTGGYYTLDDTVSSEPGSGGAEPAPMKQEPGTEYYKVGRYTLGGDGAFEPGDIRPVSAEWCALLGARNQQVYLTVAGSVIARYDFSQSPPALAALQPTMSFPSQIRFGASAAYIPLGYSGVAVME